MPPICVHRSLFGPDPFRRPFMHHDNAPRIRISSLKGLPRLMRALGADPVAVLRRFDLTPGDTNRQGFFLSYAVYAEVMEAAAEATRCAHLGILLARQTEHDLSVAGALGILITHSKTVGEAFEAMTRNYSSQSQGARYRIETQGKTAFLIREGLIPTLRHDRRLQDLSLAEFHRFLTVLCGPAFRCRAVTFTYEEPGDAEPYRQHFKCPVKFGGERQSIEFGAETLRHPIQTPDPMLEAILHGFQAPRVARPDAPLRQGVMAAIESSLGTGKCSAAGVAAVFELHPRTLHRQLSDEGTTFSDLLVEKRRELAESYLRETPMALHQISEALGYSNPSIFTRAFRRWTGLAPSEWRETHRRREAG